MEGVTWEKSESTNARREGLVGEMQKCAVTQNSEIFDEDRGP